MSRSAKGQSVGGGRGPRGGRQLMVIKVLELVGTSKESWQQAAENAVREAARTVDHITGLEVSNMTADVREGQITGFSANVKLAFAVDDNRRRG